MSDLETKASNPAGGIGLLTALFLIFLTLKLAGIGVVAGWSWWLVTLPLWGPLAVTLGIAGVGFAIFGVILGARKVGSLIGDSVRKRKALKGEV